VVNKAGFIIQYMYNCWKIYQGLDTARKADL